MASVIVALITKDLQNLRSVERYPLDPAKRARAKSEREEGAGCRGRAQGFGSDVEQLPEAAACGPNRACLRGVPNLR